MNDVININNNNLLSNWILNALKHIQKIARKILSFILKHWDLIFNI